MTLPGLADGVDVAHGVLGLALRHQELVLALAQQLLVVPILRRFALLVALDHQFLGQLGRIGLLIGALGPIPSGAHQLALIL